MKGRRNFSFGATWLAKWRRNLGRHHLLPFCRLTKTAGLFASNLGSLNSKQTPLQDRVSRSPVLDKFKITVDFRSRERVSVQDNREYEIAGFECRSKFWFLCKVLIFNFVLCILILCCSPLYSIFLVTVNKSDRNFVIINYLCDLFSLYIIIIPFKKAEVLYNCKTEKEKRVRLTVRTLTMAANSRPVNSKGEIPWQFFQCLKVGKGCSSPAYNPSNF